MAIKNIVTDFAGEVGVIPRLVRISTTDSFATVTTENYLQSATAQGFAFYPSDIVAVTYDTNVSQFFTLDMSSGNITLVPMSGNVDLPVVSGDFAVFDGTTGNLKDAGYLPSNAAKTRVVMLNATSTIANIAIYTDTTGTIGNGTSTATNPGNIHAGSSGVTGNLACYPSAPNTGALKLVATANSDNFNVSISNAVHGQVTVYSIPDVGQSTGSLLNCKVSADPGANLISFDITVGQAALAAGGSVTLIASSGSKQYKIRSLQLNSGGTNFSGGGGNRLGQVTDNTTVYSVIPAATMQSLANAQWGVTALPNPAAAAINTSTAAGASLVFKYSGGTTDYTAGSLVISGVVERVA